MNNTNQQLFVIYENISVFYQHRKLISLDEPLTQSEFAKRIQKDKYLLLSAVSIEHASEKEALARYLNNYNEKSVASTVEIFHILLIYPGTDSESKSANMMRFVNHIRYPRADTMIITQTKLTNSVLRKLSSISGSAEHKHHTFSAYTYVLLSTVIPDYELAPKYEIMQNDSGFNKDSLPKIFLDDPQMIWLGAKVGQVVKFTYLSETTIFAIGYRVVVPPLV